MSWGSQAAEGAGSSSGSMAPLQNAGGSSGFSFESPNYTGETTAAPADGTGVSLTDMQKADVADYGTSNPTFVDKSVNTLERFQKGGDANLVEAWKNKGFNAETAGYIYNKANQMAAANKQSPTNPINTTINYQQPTNPYLAKRGRY